MPVSPIPTNCVPTISIALHDHGVALSTTERMLQCTLSRWTCPLWQVAGVDRGECVRGVEQAEIAHKAYRGLTCC